MILLALTVFGAVVLSAAVMVSFHYCGGNTNVGKIGLAIREAGASTVLYVVWVGNTGMVKNRRTHANWTRQKTTKKTRRKLIAKCRCDVLHSKREEMRGYF